MSRLLKSQRYFVKCLGFVLLFGLISFGAIGGCSDGGGGNDSQALTENDFAEDSASRAELDEEVVVTFLESPMSEEAENDTGTLGEDDIPVIYEETTVQTFCWEDDDIEAMHFMELRDSEGSLILTVHVNGDCVTEVIEAGDYVISIFHDETIGDALPIFLIPNPEELEESEQASKTGGFIDRVNTAATKILNTIEKSVTKDARAQTVAQNLNTLLSTNRCFGCNLSGANLIRARLISADLRDAKLNGAKLNGALLLGAQMDGANLQHADMIDARMILAFLTSADLTSADLRLANLREARLDGADLRRADLRDAILTDARLDGAKMIGARLNRADMIGARLSGAELSVADLSIADLTSANLSGADLRNAVLERTILRGADLTDADLRFANLTKADLRDAILMNTDFNFATWCGGICRCLQDSIDTCIGCESIDICTGP
jgi:uncharacterized protein YjbI with pentapeptide repeats